MFELICHKSTELPKSDETNMEEREIPNLLECSYSTILRLWEGGPK